MWFVGGITVGLLALSANLWSGMRFFVSFQTNLQKDTLYQVFYTQNADDAFNEKMSVKKLVKAGQHEVEIDLPIRQLAKFRLDFGVSPGKVEISDLKIDGRSVVLFDDFSKFSFRNITKPKMEKNKLSFECTHRNPYIVYKDKLALKGGRSVDFYALVILAMLYFLILYKVVWYLFCVKYEQPLSCIDIVFLAIFFAFLFIPMMHISDAEKSTQENRMLAKYQPIFQNDRFNLNFGRDFDAWFRDRFWGRDELINVYYKIKNVKKYIITAKASKLKNDWYFNKRELFSLAISEKQKVQYKKNIQYLLQFCNENNIKCYMEIVPARIYFAKDGLINNKLKEYNDTLPQFIKYIKETLDFEIIYPFDELKEASKSNYVYFKTDHHWTDWGAYIGYQALLKQIKKDFPDIYEAKEGDFDISYSKNVRAEADRKYWQGYTCNLLHQNQDCVLNTDYKYFNDKNKHIKTISSGEFYNPDGKYRVVLIGNSFMENLIPFLSYSFKKLSRLRSNIALYNDLALSRWKKQIIEFKPDVLILLFQENYIAKLGTIKR